MKQARVEIGGKEYVFSLDREEIKRGEKMGLRVRLIEDEPLTQISLLWFVGLRKHQPNISPKVADDLMRTYTEEGGSYEEIIAFLLEEYSTFFQTTQLNTEKKKPIIEIV